MEKLIIDKYGVENISKKTLTNIRKNSESGPIESKKRFTAKYPGADLSKFEFSADLMENGDISKYTVYYKISDSSSYDITTDTFRNNKKWVWYLYQWRKIWSIHGTVQDFEYISDPFPYVLNKFNIYVTDSSFFTSDFPELDTSWNDEENSGEDVAVGTLKFDYENNPYYASVLSMYLATYSCGICVEHLKRSSDTPEIVTSLARYHVYYQISKFLRDPSKMTRYVSKDLLKKLTRNLQHSSVLIDKLYQFSSGAPNINVWRNSQPNKNKIINYRYARNSSDRIVGIYYQVVGGDEKSIYRRDSNDFLEFAANTSNGLTKMGQLLLQQSIESYVYCVLGAQVQTRWPIVKRGAMSLQTQEVFHRLVSDTIIQNNPTVAIRNMRKAMKDTNVILNMAVSPGIILIPSNMIILTEMVSGYNNILTLAGKGMKFGENDAVNYLNLNTDGGTAPARKPQTIPKKSGGSETSNTPKELTTATSDNTYTTDLYILITTLMGGVLISRYVI